MQRGIRQVGMMTLAAGVGVWPWVAGGQPAETNAAPLKPALTAPWDGTLKATAAAGAEEKPANFIRKSSATWWDDDEQRLQEAPENTPRFERRDGKFWGSTRGVLLELPATNLFLHSSFEKEASLTAWKTGGGLQVKRIDGGIHQAKAARLEGTGNFRQEVALPVDNAQPFRNRFCVSFLVRREDGGAINADVVRPYAATSEKEPNEIQPQDFHYEQKGRGPWTRVSGQFGWNGRRLEQDRWVCGVEAVASAALIVDAAQLEQGLGQNEGASATSYIPTEDQPAGRAPDSLTYPWGDFFEQPEGTVAFWVFMPEVPVNGYYLTFSHNAPYSFLNSGGGGIGGKGLGLRPECFLKTGAWTYLTLTWRKEEQDGVAQLFVNGRDDVRMSEGPVRYPLPLVADPAVSISREYAEPCAVMADLRIYDRALTPAQARKLFKTGENPETATPKPK